MQIHVSAGICVGSFTGDFSPLYTQTQDISKQASLCRGIFYPTHPLREWVTFLGPVSNRTAHSARTVFFYSDPSLLRYHLQWILHLTKSCCPVASRSSVAFLTWAPARYIYCMCIHIFFPPFKNVLTRRRVCLHISSIILLNRITHRSL